ncbi:MAG: response regulator [Burkholderiaceae bacterium]
MANILVVDDEVGIRELLSEILGDEGHVVAVAENAAAARLKRQAETFDLVLLDIWMPDTDGVTLLKEWAATGALTMPVIMMSGHATIDTAVEATRIGAIDFLEKPIALQKLLRAVQKGLDRGSMRALAQATALRASRAVASGLQGAGADALDPSARNGGPTLGAMTNDAAGIMPLGPSVTVGPFAHGLDASGAPLPYPVRGSVPLDLPLREARDAFERAYFEYHLAQENGSMTRVAEKTGLERTHLYRKLKQLGIELNKSPRR